MSKEEIEYLRELRRATREATAKLCDRARLAIGESRRIVASARAAAEEQCAPAKKRASGPPPGPLT